MVMQPPPPAAPAYAAVSPSAARGYGGFWIRFVAYIIDAVITGAVTFGLIKALGVITVYCPAGVTDASNPLCTGTTISPLFYVLIEKLFGKQKRREAAESDDVNQSEDR